MSDDSTTIQVIPGRTVDADTIAVGEAMASRLTQIGHSRDTVIDRLRRQVVMMEATVDLFHDMTIRIKADGENGPYEMSPGTRLRDAANMSVAITRMYETITKVAKRMTGFFSRSEVLLLVRDFESIVRVHVPADKADTILREFHIQYIRRLEEWEGD